MCAVVAGQIDCFTPRLHQTINVHHSEGLVLLPGLEKVLIVFRVLSEQEVTQGFVHLFVDNEGIELFGLGLFNLDGVTGLEVFQVRDLELEQVASSDSVVDAKGKKQQVTRLVRQK